MCCVALACPPQPVRVCVLGPPAVGKSLVASQLCEHYKLHHLSTAEVIKEATQRLVSTSDSTKQ